MAGMRKRGEKWHVDYRCGGKRYRYSLETENVRAARDEVKRLEYELSVGKHQVPKKTPLVEFLKSYLAHLLGNISHRHYRSRRSYLRMIFGEVLPELSSHATSGWKPDPLSREAERSILQAQYLEDRRPTRARPRRRETPHPESSRTPGRGACGPALASVVHG